MARYPGGKNCEGTYQRIISQIPPHECFVELFAGSAAIRRLMRPSPRSILVDLHLDVALQLGEELGSEEVSVIHGCGINWLKKHGPRLTSTTVIYADPTYLAAVCASRLRYKHVLSEADHAELLRLLKSTEARVLISGYRSRLYNHELAAWRRIDWMQITRGAKMMQESLWCNFPEPVELHDYRYIGDGYRERENIRRQQRRWQARLAAMSRLQRQALLSVLQETTAETPLADPQAGKRSPGSRHRRNAGEVLLARQIVPVGTNQAARL
jgi:hypothetical protein